MTRIFLLGRPAGFLYHRCVRRPGRRLDRETQGRPVVPVPAVQRRPCAHEATDKYLQRFAHISDPRRRQFDGMLSAMDDAVGLVLGKLRDLKLEENTLVFFISDNGAPGGRDGNGVLRGGKHTCWEGGFRLPWMVQWKGKLPAGKVEDRPVVQLDVLPTCVAAAGGTSDPAWKLDGVFRPVAARRGCLGHRRGMEPPVSERGAGCAGSQADVRAEHAWRSSGEPNAARIERAAAAPGSEVTLADLTLDQGRPKQDAGYSPLSYRDDQWYGSAYWTGPDWTRVGKDWHHPGEDTPSVRCWRAPHDGRIAVRGSVRKLHLAGDGVRATILHNQREVWKTEIAGTDDQGVEPALTLDVRQGDALRFIVHKLGAIACDTTHWDPVITYAGGEVFQASQAFGTKQGQGGWFYELVGEAGAAPAALVFHTLGLDLSLSESPAASQADAFPFVVIADGDRSGVVLTFAAAGPWNFRAAETTAGVLRITLTAKPEAEGGLPTAFLHAYEGPWTASLPIVKRHLADQVRAVHERLTAPLAKQPELDLFLLAQAEWRIDDKITESVASYTAAVADHLQRAQNQGPGRHAAELARLAETAQQPGLALADWRRLYLQTRLLKRDILLSDPLLDFDQLLFCQRVPPSYSHLVGQYFGWRQRPGGGLFVLEQPGCSLAVRNIVGGQLPAGNFLEPRLSYDGRRVAFSFVACPPQPPSSTALPVNEQGDEAAYFHIYEIGADGSGLRQLTSGCYDDLMPCYLPDGGLAFVSTRRRSYSRCFGPNFSNRWHSYTLHRMNADGSDPRILSLNDVSEWFPAVANSGEILFARWDYIDRDAVTHQNLWSMRTDGTNPIAVWGNATPKPHCTFQAKAIPGSRKIVFIASAHHAITAGPVCVLDPAVDPNSLDAVTRITPGPFPEAESSHIPEYYESPWPLSEQRFLVAYSRDRLIFEGEHLRNPNPDNALGLYLLDAAGKSRAAVSRPAAQQHQPDPAEAAAAAAAPAQFAAARRTANWRDARDGHLPRTRRCAARLDQGTARDPDFPEDDVAGQLAAHRRRRRGECAGHPGHRTGRAGRFCPLPAAGAQAGSVPSLGPGRLRVPDDAFDDLRPARRANLVRRLPRASHVGSAPARRRPAAGHAAPAVEDRTGRVRWPAVRICRVRAARAGPAMCPLPRGREDRERRGPDRRAAQRLYQVLLVAVRCSGGGARRQAGAGRALGAAICTAQSNSDDARRRR